MLPCTGLKDISLPCDGKEKQTLLLFLPCTNVIFLETCLKELRQRKLAEAFGISPSDSTKPPTYSDLLLNAAKALPTFVSQHPLPPLLPPVLGVFSYFLFFQVKTVESIFMKLLKSTDSQVKLSPMDSVQRQIVHELAKYYFLETESVGTDQNRYVVLSKKIGSRPPLFTLSQVASMQSSLPAVNSISKDVVQTHGAVRKTFPSFVLFCSLCFQGPSCCFC